MVSVISSVPPARRILIRTVRQKMESRLSPTVMILAALILWIVAIYLVTIVAPWTTVIEPDMLSAEIRAEALNAKWVAAVNQHGTWQHWERGTIAHRPAFFAAHVAALAFCGVFAFVLGFRASRIYKRSRTSRPS
jgi:hypothetical protein